MFLFRKFYDAAIADAGGGDTAVAEPIVVEEKKTESPAALMAKSGSRSTNDNSAEKPVINKAEKKEEPKTVETKSENVATTTTTSNEAEKAKPESLLPEKKVEVIQPQKEAVTQTQPSWQEVLKSQQPDNVLKELGFDDKKVAFLKKELDPKMLNFLSIWENKGDVIGYLKELTTDYSKMTPEEVMRHQLREEYPKANPKAFEALYKKKIVEEYKLDSDYPAEVEEGKMLLEAEADRHRDKFSARQQEKLLPEPPEPKAVVVDNSAAERQKQEFEAYMSTVNKDPYAEKVFEKNQIVVGKGEDKFIYPVDSNEIKNILFDTEKWAETQYDKVKDSDGSFKYIPKVENQILTAAFAKNPQKFLDEYAKHYLSLGGKKAIEPIVNAKPLETQNVSNTQYEPQNAAAMMAKQGVRVSGSV